MFSHVYAVTRRDVADDVAFLRDGSYFDPEQLRVIESLWTTHPAALARADALGDDWDVIPMTVHERQPASP